MFLKELRAVKTAGDLLSCRGRKTDKKYPRFVEIFLAKNNAVSTIFNA
jgi:hypothetical protein